jgi:hypothetical protein
MVLLRLRDLLLRLRELAPATDDAFIATRTAWVADLLAKNFPVIAPDPALE